MTVHSSPDFSSAEAAPDVLAAVSFVLLGPQGQVLETGASGPSWVVSERQRGPSSFRDWIVPAHRPAFDGLLARVFAGGHGATCRVSIETPSSGVRTVRIDGMLVAGAQACLAVVTDLTDQARFGDARAFLAQETRVGEEFFRSLAQRLAEWLGADYVCIDRLDGDSLVARTLAVFVDGHFEDNVSYALRDTPCGEVVAEDVCCYPAGVRHAFPKDEVLQTMGAEGYVGVTLTDVARKPVGLIAIITRRPLSDPAFAEALLRVVSARAGAELERLFSDEALRLSEERFASAFEHAPIGMAIAALDGRFVKVNRAFCDMLGYSVDELLARTFIDVTHPDDVASGQQFRLSLVDGASKTIRTEKRYVGRSGRVVSSRTSVSVVRDASGAPAHLVAQIEDVTERQRAEYERDALEDQLRESTKMEAVGRLAGGVAHDFNNMLGVILGHAELALERPPAATETAADLLAIKMAAERSAELTRQLLTFARKQAIRPSVVDLNDVVSGTIGMLRRLVGEQFTIAWTPKPGLWPVRIDPSQFDQVLASLIAFARDAMRGGGTVMLSCANLPGVSGAPAPKRGAGDFVLFEIGYMGARIPAADLPHLFEPFFTRKSLGEPGGLGLATVYGAVVQNGGFLEVDSQSDQGTVFRVCFPRVLAQREDDEHPRPVRTVPGTETILLVEDEPSLLGITARVLELRGFKVLGTTSPTEALAIAARHEGAIDLLITDVVMPEMNGRELRERIDEVRPAIRTLFISGYTADVIARSGVIDDGVQFLSKPFSVDELLTRVRDVLAG